MTSSWLALSETDTRMKGWEMGAETSLRAMIGNPNSMFDALLNSCHPRLLALPIALHRCIGLSGPSQALILLFLPA